MSLATRSLIELLLSKTSLAISFLTEPTLSIAFGSWCESSEAEHLASTH